VCFVDTVVRDKDFKFTEIVNALCTGRCWEMVERLKLTHFYCAPTAIRLLIKYGNEWVTKYDRSSLRVLGTVGM